MKKPELSIIIATLGFDSLYKTLDSVIENKGNHKIEIIVIGKLKDKRIENYLKLKFIRHITVSFEHGDLSKKRNIGLEEAKAEIVVFIDDDVTITKNWIDRGLRHFKNKEVGILSGPGIIPQDSGFLMGLFGSTLGSLGAGPIRGRYKKNKEIERDYCGDKIIGCNMMMRKEVYRKIGGFDSELIPAEELDFTNRAIKKGFIVYRDPEFYLFHYARSNFKKFFKQIFRFGRSKIESIERKSQPLKLIYLLPLVAVILFPEIIFLSFFFSLMKSITLLAIGLYLIFILICTLVSILETKRVSNILLMITIPIMHLAYGIGEVYAFFKILK